MHNNINTKVHHTACRGEYTTKPKKQRNVDGSDPVARMDQTSSFCGSGLNVDNFPELILI